MGKKQKTNGGDAVIYARYSSHNQRDVSIEQQVEACRKHAAELGLTVTATYEDRAISGKTDKRPSFQRMMRDAEQHKFAYVLAWKSNRIGRNMMQALVNESRLVDCGVKVFYAEEDFDDNAAGRFALRSMMNVNQFYIENMAEDVKRGLYDNAKKGLVNGSLPLGYKRGADGKPEIDEPKAAIVREIYTRVAAGELFASIADDLNARGIKTARGREWNKGSFHVLCHNDRYRGIYMYGDIRIPGGMPRIISDELFYDAQEAYGMKKDNRYGRARHGAENYLLTGKLYCGHCGGYMVGISGTSKTGEMHYYYACQKHRLEHTCEKKAIRRDVIENAVARAIMMYCLDDETIDFIVDSTIAYFKQKDHELHIEAMENELAAVQQAISNLMKAIEAGIITPTTRTRLLDLEEQQAKLSAKINTAKAERVEIDRDDLIAGLQLFRTGDIKNKKFLAKLFNTFLIAVYLYDDNRLKIVFSFTGNHNSVEIPLELDNDCPDSEIVSDETEVRMSHLECSLGLTVQVLSPPQTDVGGDLRIPRVGALQFIQVCRKLRIVQRDAAILCGAQQLDHPPQMVADLGDFFCGGQRIESPQHAGFGPILSGRGVPLCQLPHRPAQRIARARAVHRLVVSLLMHGVQGQGKVNRPLCVGRAAAALKVFRHSPQKTPPQLRQIAGLTSNAPPQLCQLSPPLVVRQGPKPVQPLRRIDSDVLCFHPIPPL